MAEEVATAVLGRLPPWPRNPLNNSVIAAEQAYRKRSGLPLLSDADMEALRAGEQMPWEKGEVSPAAKPAAPAAAAPAPPAPAAAAPAASSDSISPEVAEWVKQGKKWSRSSIAAEQARRKRNNLAALNDAEITALTGEAPEAAAPAAAPAVAAAPAAPPSGVISPEVAEWVKQGKKWSRSTVAAEQARRKRNNFSPLNDAEIFALTGEAPGAAAPAAPAAPVAGAAAAPKAAAAAARPMPPAPIARSGVSTTYVGTPAVGTSKAAAAGGVATAGPPDTLENRSRRRFIWTAVVAFLATWLLAFFRFFMPRTLFEPSTVFKIGYPTDFGMGVDTKFQQEYRIWVDRIPGRLFVIYAKCTHLGCTPDWKPAENKFKCPCHGSGYDSEGINFEGPAPRPMDRARVELAPDGQIIVDVGTLYQWPKGQPSHFDDTGAYLSL